MNFDDAIAVAKEEAREDEREETARNMLADGLDLARVARITKLPEEQIMALKRA